MSGEQPHILWLRQDLRLADHAPLAAAAASGKPVIPVFILDDAAAGRWRSGSASRWWLHHSLAAHDRALRQIGSRLVLRRGRSQKVLTDLMRETGAVAIHAHVPVEPWAKALDARMIAAGLPLERCQGLTLFPIGSILSGGGAAYRVFTPFWRACLAAEEPPLPLPAPDRLEAPANWPASAPLDSLDLLPKPDWAGGIAARWTPGEAAALARLDDFLDDTVAGYADRRDFPADDATSHLSPFLHFGEISPRTIWHACRARDSVPGMAPHRSIEAFLRELGWRDFAAHLIDALPDLPEMPMHRQFAAFPWRDDPAGLAAWKAGRTGFPIVDAGMRELWHTGYMHNRVRMIAASFLVKNLLIHWREGAAWFHDTLVDADLANNVMGWQWVAGCGPDAAPFFRVFNPVLQGEKFDPEGTYIRRHVPELATLSGRHIHRLENAPKPVPAAIGGGRYPAPLLDHPQARRRALAAYESSRMQA